MKAPGTMENPVMYRGYRITVRNTSQRFMPGSYEPYITKSGEVFAIDRVDAPSREDAIQAAKQEVDRIADSDALRYEA